MKLYTELFNVTAATFVEWVVFCAFVFINIRNIILKIREERAIKKYGGHAPRFHSYMPLDVLSGLHFLFSITAHALRDQNLKFMHNAFRRSGQGRKNPYTFEVSMLGARTLFTSDPENIRAMLATQFNDFGKGERFKKDWFELIGNGIFNVDGSAWHESRQRLRTLFTRQRVSDLACFERHVQAMIPMLGGGRAVDMKDILSRFSLDVSADFSLGSQFNSLTSRVNDDFFEAFERIRHIQSLIERLGPLNFLVPRRQFRKDLATLDEFMRPTIETAVAMSAAELGEMDKKDHGWTPLHACAAASRDKRYLRDEMVAILIAGRDTTATTLAWAFYELARNPGVLADLRREIEATVGVGSAAREPTYKDLKSMTFVTHVLNETLRLYPNAPFNIRAALKDTSLPRGGGSEGNDPVGVRAGTQVIYSTHVLQLREDLNACNAAPIEQFHPRRWESWTPQPWTYIPFNGGPRICVGQQLALTEMAYVLVRVFQQYKAVRLGKTDKPARESGWIRGGEKPEAIETFVGSRPRMASEITLSPRGPVDLVFVD